MPVPYLLPLSFKKNLPLKVLINACSRDIVSSTTQMLLASDEPNVN